MNSNEEKRPARTCRTQAPAARPGSNQQPKSQVLLHRIRCPNRRLFRFLVALFLLGLFLILLAILFLAFLLLFLVLFLFVVASTGTRTVDAQRTTHIKFSAAYLEIPHGSGNVAIVFQPVETGQLHRVTHTDGGIPEVSKAA